MHAWDARRDRRCDARRLSCTVAVAAAVVASFLCALRWLPPRLPCPPLARCCPLPPLCPAGDEVTTLIFSHGGILLSGHLSGHVYAWELPLAGSSGDEEEEEEEETSDEEAAEVEDAPPPS